MKKRVFACILALCLCVGLFVGLIAGCSHSENAPDPSKPQIVVTVFPIYDWMQNLLSDRAGEFGLTLLESSGADLHNYQPTVNDIYALSNCDLFVYIGGESDQWVADALTQAANKDMIVVNLMDALGALAREEIAQMQSVLKEYGFSFFDLAESSPKAEKTKKSCARAIRCLIFVM